MQLYVSLPWCMKVSVEMDGVHVCVLVCTRLLAF